MAAAQRDIYIEEGATYYRRITMRTSGTTPTPIDLTGFTITGRIRSSYLQTSPVKANFAITLVDAVNGIFSIELDAATTAALMDDSEKPNFLGQTKEQTLGYYNIDCTSPLGFVTRLLEGKVTYSESV